MTSQYTIEIRRLPELLKLYVEAVILNISGVTKTLIFNHGYFRLDLTQFSKPKRP